MNPYWVMSSSGGERIHKIQMVDVVKSKRIPLSHSSHQRMSDYTSSLHFKKLSLRYIAFLFGTQQHDLMFATTE